jgi:tetratricopeptide (TPR) repeat protein
MTRFRPRLLAAALLGAVLGFADLAAAVEQPTPPPPPTDQDSSGKPTNPKKADTAPGAASAEQFLAGYRTAYALIYRQGDYAAGIATLRALGHDDHADVATLIGFASRKLGRYDDAKAWYERALAADPNHAVTWSYYGMWHAEQGNLLKAREDLEKVRVICGNTECREYKALKDVIDGTATY